MRNRYPGTCYRCGEHVAAGNGHFERHRGGWRTQHAHCAIQARTCDSGSRSKSEDAPQSAAEAEGRQSGDSVAGASPNLSPGDPQ